MIDINVKDFICFESTIPQMIERKSGHTSILVLLPQKKPGWSKMEMYSHKTPQLTLNQGMRMDLNPFGIRVGHLIPAWCTNGNSSEVRFSET
jgi:NADP-dependent 3-hydroxy acid dehydrogenase YdfG